MSPTVAWSNYTGYSSTSSTFAAPVPPTIAQNDLILAQIATNSSTADTITAPDASWTALIGSSVTGGVGYAWYWHLVTSAEAATPPSAWNFTLSTARTGNVITSRITGHNTSSPWDTAVSSATSGTSSITVTGVTTSQSDCLLVGGGNLQSATSDSISVPTGWTQDTSTCTLTLGRGQVTGHLAVPTAGATGNQTFTKTSALAGAAFIAAVAPSSGTTVSGDATLTSASAMTTGGSNTVVATGTLTSAQSMTVAGSNTVVAGAALSTTSTMTVGALVTEIAAVTLSTASSATTTALDTVIATSALSSGSAITVQGLDIALAAAALTNVSTLSVDGAATVLAAAILESVSSLSATGQSGISGGALLASTAALTVLGSDTVLGVAALTSASGLDAVSGFSVAVTVTTASSMTIHGDVVPYLVKTLLFGIPNAGLLSTSGYDRNTLRSAGSSLLQPLL